MPAALSADVVLAVVSFLAAAFFAGAAAFSSDALTYAAGAAFTSTAFSAAFVSVFVNVATGFFTVLINKFPFP